MSARLSPANPFTALHTQLSKDRDLFQRHVHHYFETALEALPERTSRKDTLATVFTARGWRTRATIHDLEHDEALFGAVFSHPGQGFLVYVEKAQNDSRYTGLLGSRSHVMWAEDLTHLLDQTATDAVRAAQWPHTRVARALAAHTYLNASQQDRDTVDLLLGLRGYDLPRFIHEEQFALLSVSPC